MFKFIHTSDWHLGQNFYGYDRSEEQSDFLQQLADIVRKHTPDALLVSGDIYNTAAPSNATVNMYVNAMLDIHRACPTMAIIVIAGNHDSASRLDSDRRLWELAGVTVVGSIARGDKGKADLSHHLVNVGDKGIVAAVPFAYPSSFPRVSAEPAPVDQRQQRYFQALLDRAQEVSEGGIPVALMAHLAVRDSDFTGHDGNILMECVPISTLGQGYDYAALGHIHHPQNLDQRVRYCGTPIAVSFDEQCEHSVSIVEIDGHGVTPRITTRAIKNIKPLHTIPAMEPVDLETALTLLQQLDPDQRAYIRLNVQVERYLPSGSQERAAMAAAGKACIFCDIKKTATSATTHRASLMTIEELNSKQPIEVANQFFKDKHGSPMNEQQQEMFNYIYQMVKEENRQ
jgi:exonuclease SbcD